MRLTEPSSQGRSSQGRKSCVLTQRQLDAYLATRMTLRRVQRTGALVVQMLAANEDWAASRAGPEE